MSGPMSMAEAEAEGEKKTFNRSAGRDEERVVKRRWERRGGVEEKEDAENEAGAAACLFRTDCCTVITV